MYTIYNNNLYSLSLKVIYMYTYIYVHPALGQDYIRVYKLSISMTHIQTTTLYTKGIVLAFMYKTESLIQVADSEFRKPNIKIENSSVRCLV